MSSKLFKKTWASQSNIGKKFGLSAIAIGKILLVHGLRDSETKLPTSKAIEVEGLVTAMAGVTAPTAGQIILTGQATDLIPLIDTTWQ